MSTIFATREPLQTLHMATTQRSTSGTGTGRRHSARLMEKEDMAPPPAPTTNGYHVIGKSSTSGTATGGSKGKQVGEGKVAATKKRKAVEYDEEADGFQFTRTKSKRARKSTTATAPSAIPEMTETPRATTKATDTATTEFNGANGTETTKKTMKRKKMSFSTPKGAAKTEEKPKRRSKRLSNESESRAEFEATATANERVLSVTKRPRVLPRKLHDETDPSHIKGVSEPEGETATKIALPFADTPVIRRNKEMRQGKAGKGGERRSSLGMRGRRASSLIESGNSNALPHNEVEPQDFYKHIESEGLSEPRRMRQLLTWCATRAMGDKPSGTNTGKESEMMAARVIQEELLKDFSNKSEMSDWFAREDAPPPKIPVVKRPNPKNIQNAAKIQELEEQIKELQLSLTSLQSLHNHPPIPSFLPLSEVPTSLIDASLLDDPDQQSLLQTLISPPEPSLPSSISTRLNDMTASLEPTIDRFADGTHRLAVFRDMADKVAGRVLGSVAESLERRSGEGEEREDMRHVLRALSRVDR